MKKILMLLILITSVTFSQWIDGYNPKILKQDAYELLLEFRGYLDTLTTAVNSDTLISKPIDLSNYDENGAYTFYHRIAKGAVYSGTLKLNGFLRRSEGEAYATVQVGDTLCHESTNTGATWTNKTLGTKRAENYKVYFCNVVNAGDSVYVVARLRFYKKDAE